MLFEVHKIRDNCKCTHLGWCENMYHDCDLYSEIYKLGVGLLLYVTERDSHRYIGVDRRDLLYHLYTLLSYSRRSMIHTYPVIT